MINVSILDGILHGVIFSCKEIEAIFHAIQHHAATHCRCNCSISTDKQILDKKKSTNKKIRGRELENKLSLEKHN